MKHYLKKWAKEEQEDTEMSYWLLVVAIGLWCVIFILLAV